MKLKFTNEQKIELLLRLPWTIVPEAEEDGSTTLGVKELPAVIATGDSPAELEKDFWAAMRSVLGAYLDEGETPPLPTRVTVLPWDIEIPDVTYVEPKRTLQQVTASGVLAFGRQPPEPELAFNY